MPSFIVSVPGDSMAYLLKPKRERISDAITIEDCLHHARTYVAMRSPNSKLARLMKRGTSFSQSSGSTSRSTSQSLSAAASSSFFGYSDEERNLKMKRTPSSATTMSSGLFDEPKPREALDVVPRTRYYGNDPGHELKTRFTLPPDAEPVHIDDDEAKPVRIIYDDAEKKHVTPPYVERIVKCPWAAYGLEDHRAVLAEPMKLTAENLAVLDEMREPVFGTRKRNLAACGSAAQAVREV